MTKVYKFEVVVVDHDGIGPTQISENIQINKYFSPMIFDYESVDLGEWDDDMPINQNNKWEEEVERLFDCCGSLVMARDDATENAFQYGQIDGGHHRLWVIDQMVRALKGDEYDEWVERYEAGGEYNWDVGIAP